jgi:fumarylacetoacetase
MAMGAAAQSALRPALSRALRRGASDQSRLEACLVAQSAAEYADPAAIGDYTDFYASIHHATAVGRMFRPDQPLLPNYKWVPIGYHGRSSTIAVSGRAFPRPTGQTLPPGAREPAFGPSEWLDYEVEVGVFIGAGNPVGAPIAIGQAEQHVFGLCLLNDGSARDIQSWEYQPLDPFLSKNFATTSTRAGSRRGARRRTPPASASASAAPRCCPRAWHDPRRRRARRQSPRKRVNPVERVAARRRPERRLRDAHRWTIR